MKRQLTIAMLGLVAIPLVTAPAFSQQQRSIPSVAKAAADPNERICRDITLTGSRVVTKRFCGTRAEWEAKQQQDRDQIELMQRPMQCSVMGGHHC